MKIFSRALFLLFVLAGILIAVSNTQLVQLALWPLPNVVIVPLYLLVVALLLTGVLAGLGLGWWAGRRHRRRARQAASESARLERELARLRGAIAERTPMAGVVSPTSSEHKAIERQSALVVPDLASPTGRGPLS
jgi:uncharacterized integral membrane protein